MEANIQNLKKALAACAQAHGAELEDWLQDDGQIAIAAETVPVVNDVHMICEAFYGSACMVDAKYGYTNVFAYDYPMMEAVNEPLLKLALPKGTEI